MMSHEDAKVIWRYSRESRKDQPESISEEAEVKL